MINELIDNFIDSIRLEDYGCEKVPNFSLKDGVLFYALTLLLLGKYLHHEAHIKEGLRLLEFIGEKYFESNDKNLLPGLCEFGWVVEMVHQNRLTDTINSDEVLQDLDDLLYKTLIYTTDINYDKNGLALDVLNYFHLRTNSFNRTNHPYHKAGIVSCVTLLVDSLCIDIRKRQLFPANNLKIEYFNSLVFLVHLSLNLTILKDTKISEVEELFFKTHNLIKTLLADTAVKDLLYKQVKYMNLICFSAICLIKAGIKGNINSWKNIGLNTYKALYDILNRKKMTFSEYNEFLLNRAFYFQTNDLGPTTCEYFDLNDYKEKDWTAINSNQLLLSYLLLKINGLKKKEDIITKVYLTNLEIQK